jgi:DNA-binding IclR family transcriptional regulator
VAELLGVPEAEAMRLLDELETAGCVVSAIGPVQ